MITNGDKTDIEMGSQSQDVYLVKSEIMIKRVTIDTKLNSEVTQPL